MIHGSRTCAPFLPSSSKGTFTLPLVLILPLLLQWLCLTCVAAGPLASPGLERWLALSYVESGNAAGFGQYPYEWLEETSLYYTHGAVANATWNDIPIEDPISIIEAIALIQNPDGSFNDPSTDIPALHETWWAIQTLQLLGADLSRFASAVPFLEREMASLDLSGTVADHDLYLSIFDAYVAVVCAQAYSAAGIQMDPSPLRKTQNSLEAMTPWLVPQIGRLHVWDMSDPSYKIVSAYSLTLAHIAPEILPIEAREFLLSQLIFVERAPADVVACNRIAQLLHACARIVGWEEIPQDIEDRVWRYLQARIFPIVSDIAGFGWNGADGTRWLDAQMTFPLIEVCHLLGRSYPFAREFSDRLTPLRTVTGWGYNVQLSRDAGNSFLALEIAREIGWSGFSPAKLAAYFTDVIRATDSSLVELTYAARGLSKLDRVTPEMRNQLLFRLKDASAERLRAEASAAIALMYEFDLTLVDTGLSVALEEIRVGLLQTLATSMRLDLLWQLCRTDALLGVESLSADIVVDFVLSQQLANGGFRMTDALPSQLLGYSELVSTCLAVRILQFYDTADLVSRDDVASFLDGCRHGLGYLIAPTDVSAAAGDIQEVDFFSTYYGIRLQQFIETGSL